MLAVRLSDETEKRITYWAQNTGRSKSYYVRKAIELFLEDQEDYLSAVSRLEERNAHITFEELQRLVKEKNWGGIKYGTPCIWHPCLRKAAYQGWF